MLFTPIAVPGDDDQEYTCTALVDPGTQIPMTEGVPGALSCLGRPTSGAVVC